MINHLDLIHVSHTRACSYSRSIHIMVKQLKPRWWRWTRK